MAKEKGLYRDAGLDVTLRPYTQTTRPVDDVLSGDADYSIASSSLLIDRLKGRPVVALAAILQSSPETLLALKKSPIKSIEDIRGRRIMTNRGRQNSYSYQALLSSKGISLSDVTLLPHSFDIEDLISGKTDLMVTDLSTDPYLLREKGIETIEFTSKDHGFDLYSDILFTTEEEIDSHPQRARLFLEASIHGWEYAFEHLDESVELILKKYNAQNRSRESLLFEAKALKRLAYDHNDRLGDITKERIRDIYTIYKVLGLSDAPMEGLDGLIYPASFKTSLQLTAKEKKFLRTHKIQAISTKRWAPFNYNIDSKGAKSSLSGISYDFWMEIVKNADMMMELNHADSWEDVLTAIEDKKADISLGAAITNEREEYAIFSKPYDTFDNVIATRSSVGYIKNLSALNGKRVAVGHGYTIEHELRKHYPKIEILPVDSTHDAIKALEEEKVFAVVGLLPVLSHTIHTSGYTDLKISGTTEFDFNIRLMLRDDYPELLSIVNKAIDMITKEEREAIFNRHMTIHYKSKVDYELIGQIFLVFTLIVALLFFRQRYLKRHNLELLRLSMTDKLTQLYNRSKLDESLLQQTRLYHRYQRDFSVLMIDIDHFKKINDTYGHLAGDRVLIQMSTALKVNLRLTDILGRWGGEEFMIICPETDEEGALRLAESLRNIIRDADFQGIGRLTCSFGVSTFHGDDDIISIIQRGDDALYEAKGAGRDQVIFR